jgi:hypothetical protein
MSEQEFIIPKILQLDSSGNPMDWITYEEFATLKAKGRIAWTTGTYACTLRGGINSMTGKRSELVMDTIVAIKHEKSGKQSKRHATGFNPTLTNKMLFERDKYMCAYCGHVYPKHKLTRDHVHPVSKGGPDIWENVVTACTTCNRWKDNKTLEDADLKLLYVPYKPTFHEHLILDNRNILEDQMLFLLKGVSEHSPVYKDCMQRLAA